MHFIVLISAEPVIRGLTYLTNRSYVEPAYVWPTYRLLGGGYIDPSYDDHLVQISRLHNDWVEHWDPDS